MNNEGSKGRALDAGDGAKRHDEESATIISDTNPHPTPGFGSVFNPSSFHILLLLSDSALPLGSFAFSSGLESYLAHHKSRTTSNSTLFNTFLRLSLSTLASTSLPYVQAAYRDPSQLEDLDNDLDASTPCTVARRASVAQGRALLSVWDRSFKMHQHGGMSDDDNDDGNNTVSILKSFQHSLRTGAVGTTNEVIPQELLPAAHFAPLWGVVMRAMGIPEYEAIYLFIFSHARTVVSAGVRASVLGPYQAQSVLAMPGLNERIRELVGMMWERGCEEAGQTVPAMDLWVGRHEKLYSRIFNS